MQNYFGNFASNQPQMDSFIKDMAERSKSLMDSAWFRPRLEGHLTQPNQARSPAPLSYANGLSFDEAGYASNVPRSLIQTESSGRWDAQNDVQGAGGKGHFGALQFSHDRLADAKKAGVIPSDMTPEQFMADPQAQVRTANWHFADIDNRIYKNGLDKYLGSTVGGVPVTMDAMRSIAHLGGFGGLTNFLNTGGRYNPSDAFGTSLAAYGQRHTSN